MSEVEESDQKEQSAISNGKKDVYSALYQVGG